ncbi:MAG TPA: tetratricopeptide repeat protein [Chthonomonadaceae bacterium]|nr:tetratricopeptide repeat protein [Chthonomonadaceae bacterium]
MVLRLLTSRPDRRALGRLEIAVFIVLLPLAVYLWSAPGLAERALSRASLRDLIRTSQQQPDNPRVFYYLGLRYQQLGDMEQANAAFSRAAQLRVDDEKSWLAWAETSASIGKDEDALQILKMFLQTHPRSAPAHYALAQLYQQNGAYKRALEEARAATQANAQDPDVWRMVGEEALRAGVPEEAESALRRAVELRPADWRNQTGLGNALVERKQSEAALVCFREAVRLAPQEAVAHLCLGRALLMAAHSDSEVEAARQSLLQALALQPEMVPAYLLLGQSYARQQRWPEARRILEQTERLAPREADVAFALSGVYRHTGDTARARQEARRFQLLSTYALQKYDLIVRVQHLPNDLGIRLELARLCKAHGDYSDARYYYRSILARAPNSATAQRELAALEAQYAQESHPARLLSSASMTPMPSVTALLQDADNLFAQGDLEAAKKAYLGVLTRDRHSARAYQGVGLILNAQGKVEDALLFLEHATRLAPDLPQAQYTLAQRYREAGFADEAARRMNLVVRAAPDNAAYWYELGMDYGDADSAKAEQAYQRAVTLVPENAAYRLDLADRQTDNSRFADAEANYRRAVALAPDNADALSRLGGFLLSVRPTKARQQEARRLLERAEALAPSNEYVWYSLGRLAMQEGNAKQAVAYFERVVAQYPDIADAWYALSRAYWRLGLSARAEQADARSRQLRRDYLERVHTQELIRLRPEDPALHLKLAHLCAKKGENAKAILEYRLCLQYAPQNQAAHQELTALMAALKARRQLPSLSLLSNMVTAMAHAR